MICREFEEIVTGKDIALIGGAKNANEERALQAEIVARCNLYVHDGQRCDMAFLAGNGPDTKPRGLKWLCVNAGSPKCMEAIQKWDRSDLREFAFINMVFRGADPFGPEHEWLNMFGHQLGSMPLCGILAARLLTLCPIKSLYVTGFDFYIDDHDNAHDIRGKKLWQRGPHELSNQLDWLVSLEEFDRRVTLDRRVHEVKREAKNRGLI